MLVLLAVKVPEVPLDLQVFKDQREIRELVVHQDPLEVEVTTVHLELQELQAYLG